MRAADKAKQRDDYTCQKCGREGTGDTIQAHHIHPQWAGGENSIDNLITLCRHCHRFAPEFESEEKAHAAIDDYLDTGTRPELDLFYMGAEYGSLISESDDDIDAIELSSELGVTLQEIRDDPDNSLVKKPGALYELMFKSWKIQRVIKKNDEPWAPDDWSTR